MPPHMCCLPQNRSRTEASRPRTTELLNDGASQWVFHPSELSLRPHHNRGKCSDNTKLHPDAPCNMASRDTRIPYQPVHVIRDIRRLYNNNNVDGRRPRHNSPTPTVTCQKHCSRRISTQSEKHRDRTKHRPPVLYGKLSRQRRICHPCRNRGKRQSHILRSGTYGSEPVRSRGRQRQVPCVRATNTLSRLPTVCRTVSTTKRRTTRNAVSRRMLGGNIRRQQLHKSRVSKNDRTGYPCGRFKIAVLSDSIADETRAMFMSSLQAMPRL